MSSGFVSLEIIGNVSKPAMRKAGEHDVLQFSVAANMQRTRNGTKEGYTVWVQVQIWNKFAVAMAPLIGQGSKVFCRGEPELHKYTGNDGIEHSQIRMTADIVRLMGDKKSTTQHHETHGNDYQAPAPRQTTARQTQPNQTPQAPVDVPYDDGDDIPF